MTWTVHPCGDMHEPNRMTYECSLRPPTCAHGLVVSPSIPISTCLFNGQTLAEPPDWQNPPNTIRHTQTCPNISRPPNKRLKKTVNEPRLCNHYTGFSMFVLQALLFLQIFWGGSGTGISLDWNHGGWLSWLKMHHHKRLGQRHASLLASLSAATALPWATLGDSTCHAGGTTNPGRLETERWVAPSGGDLSPTASSWKTLDF